MSDESPSCGARRINERSRDGNQNALLMLVSSFRPCGTLVFQSMNMNMNMNMEARLIILGDI